MHSTAPHWHGFLLAAGLLLWALTSPGQPPSRAAEPDPPVAARWARSSLGGGPQLLAPLGSSPPVIVIPGIGGSTLCVPNDCHPYLGQGWPADVEKGFRTSGDPTHVQFTSAGEPRTDTISPTLIPDDLIHGELSDLPAYLTSKGLTPEVMTFDFRRSIANTYGTTASLASVLRDFINEIRTHTNQSQVNIVAHSMGTLITREYLRQHPTDSHVANAVLIAPPNLGAPKALKILRFGDDLGHSNLLDECLLKRAAHNLPGVYLLLPGQAYFQAAGGGYLIDRRSLGSTRPLNFTQTITNLKTALEPTDKWCPLDSTNDPNPIRTLSPQLVDNEVVTFHANLDPATPPTGVSVYAIAGYGNATITGITITNNDVTYTTTRAGDGTVPLVSAKTLNARKIYYADLGPNGLDTDHQGMPDNTQIMKQVVGLLKQGPGIYGDHISKSPPPRF